MKKVLFVLSLLLTIVFSVQAQRPSTYEDGNGQSSSGKFDINRVFVGGSLNLGFASNTFQVGGVPEIGYSITNWFDAGLGINLNYASERADPYFVYNNNTRYRNFTYGVGPFVRLYPIRFLFVQGQLEKNWIKASARDMNSGYEYSTKYNATSVLAGIGYTQRIVGQSSFYTLLALDLNSDPNSPYRDYNNVAIPIIRAGFNFYLQPSRRK